ncbi:MAG: NAD(P)H-hydrate dehydratase, partial [Candidatus Accumulibacter sp.]|nr:NAD(P)H-hydrate dehydratase [Accumulibacter sp.]
TRDGRDQWGRILLAAIDFDAASIVAPPGRLVALDDFSAFLEPRLRNTHKGNNGSAGVLGGNDGMIGAAWLAARAALKLGAGRVYLGLLAENAPAIDPLQPELMLRTPDNLLHLPLTALACGPGIGENSEVLLKRVCALDIPLILDADALNLLARSTELQKGVAARRASTVLTPHPAEAARLLDRDTAAIQSDRVSAALELANRFNAHVALKGCGTLIASPDGKWFVNASGNPGLSTAGSGDTLTGFVCALIAQGWPPREALLCAVHLHGAAADRLVSEGEGPIGLTAGELIESARAIFNEWVHG